VANHRLRLHKIAVVNLRKMAVVAVIHRIIVAKAKVATRHRLNHNKPPPIKIKIATKKQREKKEIV